MTISPNIKSELQVLPCAGVWAPLQTAVFSKEPSAERFRKEGADAVLFTSSSTVKSFVEQHESLTLEPAARKPSFGSIGPLTTKTMKELIKLGPLFLINFL